MKCVFGTLALLLLTMTVFSQSAVLQDSIANHKNNIKVNFSSYAFYGTSFIPAYERTIRKNQTMSLEAGIISMPSFDSIIGTNFILYNQKKNSGYKVSIDYRFYPLKENKFQAPRGIYFGPYLAYYNFMLETDLSLSDTNSATLNFIFNGDIDIYQIGFELGYQFVFYNRWTLDFLMLGPGLSYYNGAFKLNGNAGIENETLTEVLAVLTDLFPNISKLTGDGIVKSNGTAGYLGQGFRYSISVGFRF